MSRFATPLRIERVDDLSRDGRGTWQLIDPLVYESDLAGIVIAAPAGFLTDLASVPRLPVAYLMTGGLGHAAAVIHDCLYTTHVTTRAVADDVLHEALLVLGVPRHKAWMMWAGVRIGGAGAWRAAGTPQPIQPIVSLADPDYEAP
jgi:hypothetical protein